MVGLGDRGFAFPSYSDLKKKKFLLKHRKLVVVVLLHFPHCYDGLVHTKCSGQDWCVAYSVFHKVSSFVL